MLSGYIFSEADIRMLYLRLGLAVDTRPVPDVYLVGRLAEFRYSDFDDSGAVRSPTKRQSQ